MKNKPKKPDTASLTSKKGGYSYSVTDEQLAHFSSLSPGDRLRWVDDTRKFILMAETAETRKIRERLRAGK
ncbi:MAG: hypothetical protein ACC641_04700 [Acidiferrobacterales bacterium]